MTPDEDGRLASDALDMWLTLVEGRLRFFGRRIGAMLLSPGERATAEAEARRAAERRIAELEALLARRPEPPL
jgi:hypothetical protein